MHTRSWNYICKPRLSRLDQFQISLVAYAKCQNSASWRDSAMIMFMCPNDTADCFRNAEQCQTSSHIAFALCKWIPSRCALSFQEDWKVVLEDIPRASYNAVSARFRRCWALLTWLPRRPNANEFQERWNLCGFTDIVSCVWFGGAA